MPTLRTAMLHFSRYFGFWGALSWKRHPKSIFFCMSLFLQKVCFLKNSSIIGLSVLQEPWLSSFAHAVFPGCAKKRFTSPPSWCEVAHVHVAEWYHSLEWTLNWTLLSELHVEIPIPETQLLCSFCVWDFLRWLTKTMRSMSSPSRAWHQGWDVGLELVTWRHFECRTPQPVSEAFLTFWIGPCPVCYVWIFLLKRMNWPPSYTSGSKFIRIIIRQQSTGLKWNWELAKPTDH